MITWCVWFDCPCVVSGEMAWIYEARMRTDRLLGVSADSGMDALQIVFSSDSKQLYVRGDLRSSGDHELFSTVDLTTQDQSPATALLEEVPVGGDVDGMAIPY